MQAVVGQEAPFDHGRQQMQCWPVWRSPPKPWNGPRRRSARISRARARGDPTGRPVGSADDRGRAGSHSVCANGRDRSARGEKGNRGRKGKTDGQPAHTREAKLGCVFTQMTWDEEGFAIRDPDSTTYVGAIETAEEFGKRHLSGSLEAGLEPRRKEGRHGRWSRMDLEPCRSTLSRRRSDCRSVSRPPTLVGSGAELYPNEEADRKRWMMVHQKTAG